MAADPPDKSGRSRIAPPPPAARRHTRPECASRPLRFREAHQARHVFAPFAFQGGGHGLAVSRVAILSELIFAVEPGDFELEADNALQHGLNVALGRVADL